ncbi:hypothetical protein Acr_00g0076440 [Actinidia rufa]|uniref:Uncharacterized protein n=1 Tax=Actinidia rufa TaxID=165716 RepID=A0A7J0DT25_9ERIC|nr:hypothetical protein Acr_00g0076440 [Actinidia rufa]
MEDLAAGGPDNRNGGHGPGSRNEGHGPSRSFDKTQQWAVIWDLGPIQNKSKSNPDLDEDGLCPDSITRSGLSRVQVCQHFRSGSRHQLSSVSFARTRSDLQCQAYSAESLAMDIMMIPTQSLPFPDRPLFYSPNFLDFRMDHSTLRVARGERNPRTLRYSNPNSERMFFFKILS